jgi:hypothetical protein
MAGPDLSAVILVGRMRERAQRSIDALAAQTVRDAMEIVAVDLASSSTPPLRSPDNVPTVYLTRPGDTWGLGRAEALRHASGRIIAFIEDHSYADPGWAEALIAAHEGPWAAVGYGFRNANPESYVARSSFFHDYGRFAVPIARGPAKFLPSNNVAYKRAALDALGPDLESVLAVDFNIHEALTERNLPLFLESKAIVAHESFSRIGDLGQASFHFCRLLAANRVRARHWSLPRRVVYGTAAPVAAPMIKLARVTYSLRGRRPLWRDFVVSLPVMALIYGIAAVGESLGYLAGAAEAPEAFTTWELDVKRAAQ